MPKLACVSINLTGLPHLCRQHGIDERSLPPAGAAAVSRRAPERFAELFDRKSISATFFAVGEDLEDGPSAMAVAEAARLGHEIGNLSQTHDMALARKPARAVAAEVRDAGNAIEKLAGRRPVGFRAPAHAISSLLLEALEDQDYLYDASILPSPPGYAARAAMSLLRRSEAPPERPDATSLFLAPREPYRPSPRDPYRRGSSKLIELPVATAPLSRIPFTGALLLSLPKAGLAALYRAVRFRDFLSIELQGHDLLDESDGVSDALARRRRDLRQPVAVKLQRISELLDWLRDDFEVVTLEEAAHRLAPKLR